MSRIGRRPIPVPAGVDIKINTGEVVIRGPKGTLTQAVHAEMIIKQAGAELLVDRPSDTKTHRSLHGLTRTLLANMVEGVTSGYSRTLDVQGVGYRTALNGKNLTVSVGYSHGIEVPPPPGIEFEAGVEQGTRLPFIIVKGIDKQLVGQTAARIRALRKPEPYKGKGIRYRGEEIRRKAGKSGKAGAKGGKK